MKLEMDDGRLVITSSKPVTAWSVTAGSSVDLELDRETVRAVGEFLLKEIALEAPVARIADYLKRVLGVDVDVEDLLDAARAA